MSEFDESLMKACELLKDLTNEKTKCLDAFIKCQDVVLWLKESMKMCMSQLLFNILYTFLQYQLKSWSFSSII